MKIAIATFASMPNPPVLGGAVESLIDVICTQNESQHKLDIDIFSVYHPKANIESKKYHFTKFNYYKKKSMKKWSCKNIAYKLFKVSLLDRNMKKLVRDINKESYDFVIVTSIIRELKIIFSEISSPVIWYLHGDAKSVLPDKDLSQIVYKCIAVLTVSEFIRKRINTVKPRCPVITVLNCIDIEPVCEKNEIEIRRTIRKKAGVSENEKLFLYVGRITPIKGILELIQAFTEVDLKDTKLLIVGSPDLDSEKEYYQQLKIESNKNIIFYGYVEHEKLNEIYCAADCVVAPSVCKEAALLIGGEALRCKKKVIATDIGGIPEYVYGENFILISYDSNFKENIKEALCQAEGNIQYIGKPELDKFSPSSFYQNFVNALTELKRKI